MMNKKNTTETNATQRTMFERMAQPTGWSDYLLDKAVTIAATVFVLSIPSIYRATKAKINEYRNAA